MNLEERQVTRELLLLATGGLSWRDSHRVAEALDCAIVWGALERAAGNESLQDLEHLRDSLEDKLQQFRVNASVDQVWRERAEDAAATRRLQRLALDAVLIVAALFVGSIAGRMGLL